MASAFDQRIVKIGIELPNGTVSFEKLNIEARGNRIANAIMGNASVLISNVTNQQKHDILTLASPQKTQGRGVALTIDVGRESYGTFRLYQGYVISCGASQPPDIGLVLESMTNAQNLSFIRFYNAKPIATLQEVAQLVANENGLKLQFQATNRNIDNFSFTGAAARLIDKLNQLQCIAFRDIDKLVVVDIDKGVNAPIRIVSKETGMVGIPETTQYGLRVRVMIDPSIVLYGRIQVISEINPSANGVYVVYKMAFEVATRDQPFWYILDCKLTTVFFGGAQ